MHPKSTLSRGPIAKPHYLAHPWTGPTSDAKRHADPIRRFSTMHCTDRRTCARTDRPTDRSRESLTTIGRCAPRATRPKMAYSDFCVVLRIKFSVLGMGLHQNCGAYHAIFAQSFDKKQWVDRSTPRGRPNKRLTLYLHRNRWLLNRQMTISNMWLFDPHSHGMWHDAYPVITTQKAVSWRLPPRKIR